MMPLSIIFSLLSTRLWKGDSFQECPRQTFYFFSLQVWKAALHGIYNNNKRANFRNINNLTNTCKSKCFKEKNNLHTNNSKTYYAIIIKSVFVPHRMAQNLNLSRPILFFVSSGCFFETRLISAMFNWQITAGCSMRPRMASTKSFASLLRMIRSLLCYNTCAKSVRAMFQIILKCQL